MKITKSLLVFFEATPPDVALARCGDELCFRFFVSCVLPPLPFALGSGAVLFILKNDEAPKEGAAEAAAAASSRAAAEALVLRAATAAADDVASLK